MSGQLHPTLPLRLLDGRFARVARYFRATVLSRQDPTSGTLVEDFTEAARSYARGLSDSAARESARLILTDAFAHLLLPMHEEDVSLEGRCRVFESLALVGEDLLRTLEAQHDEPAAAEVIQDLTEARNALEQLLATPTTRSDERADRPAYLRLVRTR